MITAIQDMKETLLQVSPCNPWHDFLVSCLPRFAIEKMPVSFSPFAYIINEGRVLSQGSRDFLINDPVARETYLGHRFSM